VPETGLGAGPLSCALWRPRPVPGYPEVPTLSWLGISGTAAPRRRALRRPLAVAAMDGGRETWPLLGPSRYVSHIRARRKQIPLPPFTPTIDGPCTLSCTESCMQGRRRGSAKIRDGPVRLRRGLQSGNGSGRERMVRRGLASLGRESQHGVGGGEGYLLPGVGRPVQMLPRACRSLPQRLGGESGAPSLER